MSNELPLVTYFAYNSPTGEHYRGELVPQAAQWPYLGGEVRIGNIVPVLVSVLCESDKAIFDAYHGVEAAPVAPVPVLSAPARKTTAKRTPAKKTAARKTAARKPSTTRKN